MPVQLLARLGHLLAAVCSVVPLFVPNTVPAQQAPRATLSPRGQLITNANRTVPVTVKWCKPWNGGAVWASKEILLDATDITSQFSYTSGGQDGSCEYYEIYSATITLAANPSLQTLSAVIEDVNGWMGQDNVDFALPAPWRGVLVATDAGLRDVLPGTTNNLQYVQIWNTGEVAATYALSVSCAGAASSCYPSQYSVSISPHSSVSTGIYFNASSTLGDTGSVHFTAVDITDGGIRSSGWTDVRVKSAPSAGAVIARSMSLVPRGSCVTASLGGDAAMECGDLRVVHPLPAVTTFGKVRVPTLIYNSAHASVVPVVLVDVTVPGGTLPSSVEARVYVDGVQRGYKSLPGSDWAAGGNTRRMSVAVDATGWGTSLRNYYVQVTLVGGSGGPYTTPTEQLAIVNRSGSHFGAGWGLAGLEEIFFINSSTILWVGGDGSTRVYNQNAATTFRANDFERPDTITQSGSDYIRWGAAKQQVRFSSAGLHVSTTNRLGQVTTFGYQAGTRRLTSISVPVRSGSALTYSLSYDGNGVLYQVSAPTAGVARTVSIARNGFQITSITDPNNTTVYFGYGTGADIYRIASRTDRRGYVLSFGYNSLSRLTSTSLNMGGTGATIAQAFNPIETRAYWSALPLDSVYTHVDGPRTDVADETKIWVNKYGAPTRIRNAEGRETLLTYDATWPGLVAEMRSPSRQLTQAVYNTDGTLLFTTAFNPLGTGVNDTTRYTWDPTWKFVTSITPTVGPATEFSYASNGNRLWEQTGGSSRRVNYGYDGSGQLSTVTPPGIPATTYSYNTLGNVSETLFPKGTRSFIEQNAIGQDTIVASQFSDTTTVGNDWGDIVPNGAWNGSRVKNWYDPVGRVTKTVTYGPKVGRGVGDTIPADSLRVEYVYDYESNVKEIERTFWLNGAGHIYVDSNTYDGAGRRLGQFSAGSNARTFTYDAAGNLLTSSVSGGATVTMTYDALNRLSTRITPQVSYGTLSCTTFYTSGCYFSFPTIGGSYCVNADTARLYYDPAGNLYRADNRYARVRRSYTQSGLLKYDTLVIRAYHEPGETPCTGAPPAGVHYGGAEWQQHVYVLEHGYDLAGRRTSTKGPYAISGCVTTPCTTSWAYSTTTGELSSVTDGMNPGRTTSFVYDNAGRRTVVNYPNGVTDTSVYDNESRVVRHVVGSAIADNLTYDAAGRLLRATIAYRNGQYVNQNIDSKYGPLGALVLLTNGAQSGNGTPTVEKFDVDALGNRRRTWQLNFRPNGHPDTYGVRSHWLDSFGRLTSVRDTVDVTYDYEKDVTYDVAGRVHTTRLLEDLSAGLLQDASINYYDAADRLRAFNRHIGIGSTSSDGFLAQHGVFEEYVYDALGRRVLVRSRRGSLCNTMGDAECSSYVERTVWDGDQILYEVRAPGGATVPVDSMENDNVLGRSAYAYPYGQVAYVHAGALDQPIAVLRMNMEGYGTPETVYPHTNWRGMFEVGSRPNGTFTSACGSNGCPPVYWPGFRRTADGGAGNPGPQSSWFGSLIPGKADGSGMQYMRNRYYDPSTGRFTQEDPIGLAGGMNLYGFAHADPVNFSDPFGLSECEKIENSAERKTCEQDAKERARAWATCRADAGQFALSLTANMLGVGSIAYARSAVDMTRTAKALDAARRTQTGLAAAVAADQAAAGAWVANAMYYPSFTTLKYAFSDAGTDYGFTGKLGLAYEIGKAVPVFGAGLELGETIRSCGGAAIR